MKLKDFKKAVAELPEELDELEVVTFLRTIADVALEVNGITMGISKSDTDKFGAANKFILIH